MCDKNRNIISPFVPAPGNRNENMLLGTAMFNLKRIAKTIGLNIKRYESRRSIQLKSKS